MDDEIQSCKTHSECTQSYQVAIPVPFVSLHSKSFGLAYCWVHSHWKTTADLFNAQYSIQFARIKRSFISARVLISTFDGLTSSSRMACWVRNPTVKVPLLHQTYHAVPSKWWYKQQHYVPFVSCWDLHQSANTAFKAIAEVQASVDNTKPNNASSFNNKPSSTFQLVVALVDWISKSISSLGRIKANENLQSTRQEAAPNFNIGRLYELIVDSKDPNHSHQLIVDLLLIPNCEGARAVPITHYSASEGGQSLSSASNKSITFLLTTIHVQRLIFEFPHKKT
jgi:hypothetical protein